MEPAIQEVEESFVSYFKVPKTCPEISKPNFEPAQQRGKYQGSLPFFLGEFIQEVLQKFPHHQVHH